MQSRARFLVLIVSAVLWTVGYAVMGCASGETDPLPDPPEGGSGGTGGSVGGQGGAGGEDWPCGIDCSTIGTDLCRQGVCNTDSGQCEIVNAADDTECDDEVFCTTGDHCESGACVGGPPNDCGLESKPCEDVNCNEASEQCSLVPTTDGGSCATEDLCQVNGRCEGGVCLGVAKDCTFAPVPNECYLAKCNPSTGDCDPEAGNDGNSCTDDNDPCMINGTCDGGACLNPLPKDCSGETDPQNCVVGVCNAVSGNCEAQQQADGDDCDDLDACTAGTTCSSGACTGGAAVVACVAYDGCCPAGCDWQSDVDCAGTVCAQAMDVSGASFPVQLQNTFDDDPAAGGSCDTTPTNVVWFAFTPATTGYHQIDLQNFTGTYAYSRVAVFAGAGCSPLGAEIACKSNSSKTVSATIPLTQGVSYRIMFYTDGDSYTMIDPQITITEVTFGPGEACTEAVDLSAQSFPYTLNGTFGFDPPVGGLCDTTPTNAVYFRYTPATDGWYEVTATNATATNASSRLAIFQTAACGPHGPELGCTTSYGLTVAASAYMTQGTEYLLVFYTDGDSYTMEDPQIDIQSIVVNPGEACQEAVDLTGQTLPYQLTGTFDLDPSQGGSCETTPNNAVFFRYTPSSSASFTISAENFTATNAWSRLAIFETAACIPYGTEIDCVTSNDLVPSITTSLVNNTEYLIMFYTDGDTYTMVDPQIDIQ